jgi:hypothetical protein
MSKLKILSYFFILSTSVYCQSPSLQWSKCYGGSDWDEAKEIVETFDGNFVVAGWTYSIDGDVTNNHGIENIWIIKIDQQGNLLWQKCLGGSYTEGAFSLKQTPDSGFIITGFSSSNDFDALNSGNHGLDDIWVVKTDSLANIQWQKCYGGSAYDNDNVGEVQIVPSGGYIVSGEVQSNDGDVTNAWGDSDYWVIRLDSVGNLLWQHALGGTGYDICNSLLQSGNTFGICGTTASTNGDVTVNHGGFDSWSVIMDSSGNIIHQKSFGGSGGDEFVGSYAHNSFIYYCGVTESNDIDVSGNHGALDIWLVKCDTGLNIISQKCIGWTDDDAAWSTSLKKDSNFLAAGVTFIGDSLIQGGHGMNDGYITEFDTNGIQKWSLCFGGTYRDELYSVIQTRDSGFIAVGFTESNDGDITQHHGIVDDFTGRDIWIVKLSPLTNVIPNSEIEFKDLVCYYSHSNLQLIFISSSSQQVDLDFFDSSGRLLLKKKIEATSGKNELVTQVQAVKNGVYIIQLGEQRCKLIVAE